MEKREKIKLPSYFNATKRTNTIFLGLFILALLISLFQFPMGKIMKGETDVQFNVGWPMTFLVFDFENSEGSPFKLAGLFVDLMVYLLIGYIIDVLIALSWKTLKEKNKVFDEWSKKRAKRLEEIRLLRKKTL